MIPPGKILVTLCIVCLSPLLAFTQHFNYRAELDAVDSTGFYTIAISPQLSAYTKTDFADIRIADKKKQWVPHILQPAKAMLMKDFFTAFPILQNTVTDSGKNLLIIENSKTGGIYNLELFIKNSSVSRTAVLSGSNNLRNWYIIDDDIAISRSYETINDEYLQEINFPLAKYRYFKIVIDNAHNDPLLVTKAGFYAQPEYKKSAIYQDNPIPVIIQKDSNYCSYIEVRQDDHYQFDKISLSISGPKYYSREVEIYLPYSGKNHRAKTGQVIGNFKLKSGLPAIFELPRTKSAMFFVVIKNADNPPLKIEKIVTQQQTISLVTFLEQGKKYELLLGDSLASFADYDLQAFEDSITVLRPLNYGKVQAIKNNALKNTSAGRNRWIWPSVIIAGMVLSFLTYRLTGEINKSKT
ncbi:MAG: hypothetical protein H7Z13_01600 [Ferruginibacter sp.]|nr:hypothetical protein [Ferruginibacter sp.]